ncbi:MAG: hypothetical protein KIS78_16250 [Labilithrix sp.]|nr:hypothetical protein [Labilithrix sp.]
MTAPSPRVASRLLALLFVVTAAGVGVVSTLPSCNGPPDKTCFAERVHALGANDDAGPDRTCTTCLQTRNAPNACCDAVGACDDDPTNECVSSFQAAHRCVIEGGPSEEARCKGLLTNDRSRNLYACMRGNCGRECGVPSCDVDPAVILFANPACDSCIGGACCEKINACYGSRACKLALECITKHCPRTLGDSMTKLESSPELRLAAREAVCTGRIPDGVEGPGACVERCLDDFAPGDGTIDDLSARCMAFDVYACGAEASCGPKCVRPDAGPYSGEGEWPEDAPPDAPAGDGG